MSVLIVTSLGDLVVDLYTDRCPLTAKNFLKLCKIKYYNGCLFHTVQKDFTAQTGDPTGKGTGGDSIYKFLYGDQARFFGDEIHLDLKHSKTGTVAMASAGENLNASQFYFTLRDDLDYLDEKHTVFGEVAEGLETLSRMNEAYVDEKGRPYKNIRIKHTYILDDPFDDPPQLVELIPEASPEGKPKDEIDDDVRLEDDWVPMDEKLSQAELEEIIRAKEAHSSAIVLESIGDIPEAEIKPPENVLFVCKLNPVTEDEDLHTIFSRFGNVISAEVIRDYKTGGSLCYAFIEFETKEACEQAYYKMDNALIDDRRIHVDFSQSVSKLWSQFRRKDNQMGKGCFKCGAIDHIARDCTMDGGTQQQPPKYMIKDENIQRGGNDNSRYEMVFDGDMPASSEQDKRHRDHEPEDHSKRQKIDKRISEDLKHKEHESYRPGHEDRSRRHREDQSNEEYNASRYGASKRDEELSEGRGKREHTYRDRDIYRRHDSRADRRDRRERSREEEHGDGRPDKEKARQKRDDYKRHGSPVDKREERDYKRRDSDRYQDKKDERNYRGGADKYSHGDRKEEPNCGKREDNDSQRDYGKRREYTDHADKRERRRKDSDHYLDRRYKEDRRL